MRSLQHKMRSLQHKILSAPHPPVHGIASCAPSNTRSSPPLTLQHHLNRGLRDCGGKVQTWGMGHAPCAMRHGAPHAHAPCRPDGVGDGALGLIARSPSSSARPHPVRPHPIRHAPCTAASRSENEVVTTSAACGRLVTEATAYHCRLPLPPCASASAVPYTPRLRQSRGQAE